MLRAGLDQSAIPSEIKCSKAIALQDYGNLDGPALVFAESVGIGPHEVDSCGWTLLHHAVNDSEEKQGMTDVGEGLLREMSAEAVDSRTLGVDQ